MSPDFSLRGFLEQIVYCSNPRHLEDLEHNTEHAVAGTDQQTLREGATNSVKRVNVCLKKRWWTFSAFTVHTLYCYILCIFGKK
jgi:hypothetical protein